MSFRTVDGTATTSDPPWPPLWKGGSGGVAKTGTLTFNPGETTKTITPPSPPLSKGGQGGSKGDSKKEANETFYLDLYGLSINGLFTKNRGIGTILNDD